MHCRPPIRRAEEAGDALASAIVRRTARVVIMGASRAAERIGEAAIARGFATVMLDSDAGEAAEADIVVVCSSGHEAGRGPAETADRLRATLRRGQLVILEAAYPPGTTRRTVLPSLESSGLVVGRDFFLCASSARQANGSDAAVGRVLGGITPACLAHARRFYGKVVDRLVTVASVEEAELVGHYLAGFERLNTELVREFAETCGELAVDPAPLLQVAVMDGGGALRFRPGGAI